MLKRFKTLLCKVLPDDVYLGIPPFTFKIALRERICLDQQPNETIEATCTIIDRDHRKMPLRESPHTKAIKVSCTIDEDYEKATCTIVKDEKHSCR